MLLERFYDSKKVLGQVVVFGTNHWTSEESLLLWLRMPFYVNGDCVTSWPFCSAALILKCVWFGEWWVWPGHWSSKYLVNNHWVCQSYASLGLEDFQSGYLASPHLGWSYFKTYFSDGLPMRFNLMGPFIQVYGIIQGQSDLYVLLDLGLNRCYGLTFSKSSVWLDRVQCYFIVMDCDLVGHCGSERQLNGPLVAGQDGSALCHSKMYPDFLST